MGRGHTIHYLDSETRRQIDAFLAESGRSVDEFVDFLNREIGLDISRSSAHRYMQSFDEVAQSMRESREMADALVKEIGPAAEEGRVGQLITEMLQNIIFNEVLNRQRKGESVSAQEIQKMAQAAKDLISAQKADTDRIAKERAEADAQARREEREQAAAEAAAAVQQQGASAETCDQVRQKILGAGGA